MGKHNTGQDKGRVSKRNSSAYQNIINMSIKAVEKASAASACGRPGKGINETVCGRSSS